MPRRSPQFPYLPKEIPTSRLVLLFLMVVALCASAVYWWGVQSTLIPDNRVVALAFTAILVLAPPALVSFLIPWSPAGMLLQKVNAKTWGYVVVVGCSIYLLYYSFQIQWSWWAAQPVVAESGLIYQQVFIGLIGFIIIPALLWTPVSSDELVEQVRQAHLVKRYELQTQADIAILRATLLRAQEKALVGFANLTVEEKEELSAVMMSLVTGIDKTLREIGRTVKTVSGVAMPFDGMLDDNEDIRDVLEYISDSLTGSELVVSHPEPARQSPMARAQERVDAVRESRGWDRDVRTPEEMTPRVGSHSDGRETRYLNREEADVPDYAETWNVTFTHPKSGKIFVAPFVRMDGPDYIIRTPDGSTRKVLAAWIVDENRDR